MKKIPVEDIVAFAPFCGTFPIDVDPVYANADHPENHFGQIYHPNAQIWGHRDLVKIVLLAAKRLHQAYGWTLMIKDCLRPVEAQARMIDTPIVKANPHWIEEPRFLSGPGQGGHPRGMAIDLDVEGIDFGTAFDHFGPESHRQYELPEAIRRNRGILEDAMVKAANDFGLPLLPLPQEWWDFRFPASYTNEYEALRDDDLLPHQKMTVEAQKIEMEPDPQILQALNPFMSS